MAGRRTVKETCSYVEFIMMLNNNNNISFYLFIFFIHKFRLLIISYLVHMSILCELVIAYSYLSGWGYIKQNTIGSSPLSNYEEYENELQFH